MCLEIRREVGGVGLGVFFSYSIWLVKISMREVAVVVRETRAEWRTEVALERAE